MNYVSLETAQFDTLKQRMMSTFPNPNAQCRLVVKLVVDHVTAMYREPDGIEVGNLEVTYKPGKECVEIYELKDFVDSLRRRGLSKEEFCRAVHGEMQSSCSPLELQVEFVTTAPAGEYTVL